MTKEQIEAEIKKIKDANAEDEGLCYSILIDYLDFQFGLQYKN